MVATKQEFHIVHFIVVFVSMLLYLYDVEGFGFTTPKGLIRSTSRVVIFGWFDFKPFHGSGSGDSKAFKEEQWKIQQDILHERANKGLTKDKLKKKYEQKTQTNLEPKSKLVDIQSYTVPTPSMKSK